MSDYVIRFPFKSKHREIEIVNSYLFYFELCDHSGCQVNNTENKDLIHKKCKKIANLIREIDQLNK